MNKPVESSGTVAFEENGQLTLVRKPAQWTTTFLFVSWLVTVIVIANAIIPVVMLPKTGTLTAVFLLSGIGLLFLTVTLLVTRYKRKTDAIPLKDLAIICTFDFNSGKVLDQHGQAIAAINDTFLTRRMQFTSSSPSLTLVFPGGSIRLVNGNPFSGGVSAIENLLHSRGIRKK